MKLSKIPKWDKNLCQISPKFPTPNFKVVFFVKSPCSFKVLNLIDKNEARIHLSSSVLAPRWPWKNALQRSGNPGWNPATVDVFFSGSKVWGCLLVNFHWRKRFFEDFEKCKPSELVSFVLILKTPNLSTSNDQLGGSNKKTPKDVSEKIPENQWWSLECFFHHWILSSPLRPRNVAILIVESTTEVIVNWRPSSKKSAIWFISTFCTLKTSPNFWKFWCKENLLNPRPDDGHMCVSQPEDYDAAEKHGLEVRGLTRDLTGQLFEFLWQKY